MAVVAVTLMSTTAMCLRSRMSLRRGSLWVRLWRRAVLRTRGFYVLLRLGLRTVLDPRLRLRLLHWPILRSWLRLGLRRRPIFNARLRLRL
jgi:hypothetical protein